MNETNLPNWLVSSTGEGLSLRVKSFLVGVLPTVLVVSKLIGHPILETDANTTIDLTVTLIEAGVAFLAAIYHAVGWVRARFYKKNNLGKFAK